MKLIQATADKLEEHMTEGKATFIAEISNPIILFNSYVSNIYTY